MSDARPTTLPAEYRGFRIVHLPQSFTELGVSEPELAARISSLLQEELLRQEGAKKP